MLSQERFWLVWCPDRGEPSIKHLTREEAKFEAVRIATREAKAVHVLECVGSAYPREAQWESCSNVKFATIQY